MDGHRGVDNLGLDRFFVDYGHNSLVDVVVDMFSSDSWGGSLRPMYLLGLGRVLKVAKMRGKFVLGLVFVFMAILPVFGREDVVRVLLREPFFMGYGLDSGVVVMLMDLTINGLGCFFMLMRSDRFPCDSRVDGFLHRGMMTPLGGEL